jgi:hypothetical protein
VRQPRTLHQTVDPDAVEAVFPKQSPRNIENPLAIPLCLFPGHLHWLTPTQRIFIRTGYEDHNHSARCEAAHSYKYGRHLSFTMDAV